MARIEERLKSLLLLIRFSGVKHVIRLVRYALKKDRLDQSYLKALGQASAPVDPGVLLEAQPGPTGARFRFERAELEIIFLAPDLIRVSWTPGEAPVPYAIHPAEWPAVQVKFVKNGDGYCLSTSAVKVTVQPDGSLTYFSPEGKVLRSEQPPARQGRGWTLRSSLSSDEHILGLGEQAGNLNLRGGTFDLWNTDPGGSYGPGKQPLYMPLPVYLGLHAGGGYLVFHENYSRSTIRFDPLQSAQPAFATAAFNSGMLRTYFIPGLPIQALRRFTDLTGRAGLPPRWSLGYHQSRWGYKNEADIRAVVAGFREHDLQVDAIHLDIDYMDGFRVFTIDPQRFPNLGELAAELAGQGIRLVTILDPGVKQDPGYFVYREGLQAGVFCKMPPGKLLVGIVWPGWSLYPDFTNPVTRRWWGDYYPRLLDHGIAGFWHDMNEPAAFTAWGDSTAPLAMEHAMEGQGGKHIDGGHNLYALLMNQAGHEALQKHRPHQRPWVISRSGWVSQQRYAWNWTGDTESTWVGLRMTIPTIIGMGLSGLPFVGPDIGGFSGNPSAELFLRSFQMATFLPFFRTHSAIGTARREPWAYGEPYTSLIRAFLQLRTRLLPYLYTQAWHSCQTGDPMVRPIFWPEPYTPELWEVEDAFFLGETLLVAPVMTEGVAGRTVVLPAGRWYDFWGDAADTAAYEGGQQVTIESGLDRIPVLVKAGSVLPMEEKTRLDLHLYAPEPGAGPLTSRLYSDAGDGYGPARVDQFELEVRDGRLWLNWDGQGEYPFPYETIRLHLHGWAGTTGQIDGREVLWRAGVMETGVFKTLSAA